jgi:hypothetical protein
LIFVRLTPCVGYAKVSVAFYMLYVSLHPLTVCVYVCGPRKVVLIVNPLSHRRLVNQPGTYLVV